MNGFLRPEWRRCWPALLLCIAVTGEGRAQIACDSRGAEHTVSQEGEQADSESPKNSHRLPEQRTSAAHSLSDHHSPARPACAALNDSGYAAAGRVPTLEEVRRAEAEKTSSPLFQQVKASIRTLDSASVEAVTPGRAANPSNVRRIELILSAADWGYLFPQREATYTYTRFLQAVAKFPALCGDYSDGRDAQLICRKTLATMFAHFAQETGGHNRNDPVPEWRQGLVHLREMGCNEAGPGCEYNAECNPNVWQGKVWPCGKNPDGSYKKYFGRGAKQLSYNYNYGPFSDAMFGSVRPLLDTPDLVASTWLNLASATFFFVYPQPPKPSMLFVVDGAWQPNNVDRAGNISAGFGATINIINGGIECGAEKPQAANRVAYYRAFAQFLGVPISPTEQLGCATQKPFEPGGAGALNIYWEMDWSWDPNYPDGKSYACKLVSYQTPFSALRADDYLQCIEKNFNVVIGPGNPDNAAPSADAGPDQNVFENAVVTLAGTGSDIDGSIVGFRWSQSGGAAVALNGADTARASFTAPRVTADTTLTFVLTVTDDQGASASDSVLVIVRPQAGGGNCAYAAWSRDGVYVAGNRVIHQRAAYEAKWWTKGDDPAATGQWGPWRKLNDCATLGRSTGVSTDEIAGGGDRAPAVAGR